MSRCDAYRPRPVEKPARGLLFAHLLYMEYCPSGRETQTRRRGIEMAETENSMTYDVGYDGLDGFKRLAQAEARKTNGLAKRLGIESLEWTRGESVFIMKFEGRYLGFVIEGL